MMTDRYTIMERTEQSDRQKQQSIEQAILLALKGIRFGSVEFGWHTISPSDTVGP